MNNWDQLHEWLATLVVATVTWAYGLVTPVAPLAAQSELPVAHGPNSMLGWAQQEDQPPIEQVGEETGDVENLDEGAPPATDTQPAGDETLDAGPAPSAEQDDVELLDQGAPPAQVATTEAPAETVYVAPGEDPSTAYVAPAPAAGPVLPEGFGTGRVHASAGRSGFPPGLEDCHVGAVTGRAYVGLDCGEDEETAFVGHAPSFEEFPFVVDAPFPFEGDEAFFRDDFPLGDDVELAVAGDRDADGGTDIFVSAGTRARDPEEAQDANPVIETSGESSVAFAQRARDREPRVHVDDRSSNRNRNNDSARRERGNRTVASERADNGTNAESAGNKDKKKTKNKKNKDDNLSSEGKKQKAKGENDKKKRAERKDDRKRSRDGN